MIKLISASETLALRSKVLRDGIDPDRCVFPEDGLAGTFHMGFYADDVLVSIASFFPDNHKNYAGIGYRLRGMATDPDFSGKGYGAQLLNFAVNYLKNNGSAYLWGNARSAALGFYEKLGFTVISPEFEIAGIGPHFEMILNFK